MNRALLQVVWLGAGGAKVFARPYPGLPPEQKVKTRPVVCGIGVRIGWIINGGGRSRTDGGQDHRSSAEHFGNDEYQDGAAEAAAE